MIDNDKPRDTAVEKELAGVPEELLDRDDGAESPDDGDHKLEDAIAKLHPRRVA